jgi:hypothetical protein
MLSRRIRSMIDPFTCEGCRAVFELTKPTDIDGSFRELIAAGWMHFAKKGRGRERWTWKCAACTPQGSPVTMGLTTGHMMSSRKD